MKHKPKYKEIINKWDLQRKYLRKHTWGYVHYDESEEIVKKLGDELINEVHIYGKHVLVKRETKQIVRVDNDRLIFQDLMYFRRK